MSAFLVIERPGHAPSVLGTFSTQQDAEEAYAMLLTAKPKWRKFVTIRVGKAPKRADGKKRN